MNYSKEPKQEGDNISRVSSSFASGPWFRSKDPRIVRVSRAFGGKDRHSKVCTVRGLRDRRVRLSVPTAIQLYDLQDRLGLSQPSKVVDWLLEAAKNEIDELPPLPNIIHPLNFGQPLFIDQNRVANSTENWGRSSTNHDEEQEDEGSEDNDRVGEEIPTNNNNFGHNNPFLFPYGYSDPSNASTLVPQLQVGDESHGFVSIAHHLLPCTASGNYIPMPYLRTSLVEMDHQIPMASQQLQMGSGSMFSGRLPFDFNGNARVAPSNNGGDDVDRE